MDIARPELKRKRRRRRIIYGVSGLIALALITMGLQRLQPAAPTVENAYLGTVERGPMLRQVRGNGILVPEEIRSVTAYHPGRVEEMPVKVGAVVQADTILIKLSNPELEQAAFDAEWTVKGAEAQFTNLLVTLENQKLSQQSAAATALANYNRAKLDAEVNEVLAKDGLIPVLTLRQSKSNAMELKRLCEIENERLKIVADSATAQLSVQEAQIRQVRAQLELKRRQVDSLRVRAGIDGVLQKLGEQAQLQIGQQVGAGAFLARVANQKKLMAEIKIPETQARDVELDQFVEIDTRNGIIPGHIVRIDPAAQSGTRTVDVKLDGPLPRGAVPELSVDANVLLEKLNDVVFVGRPVHGQTDSTVGLFKVVEGGKAAIRVPVKLGRNSVSVIEVVEGLQPGDQVILSDMSAWDAFQRVRLN